MDRIDQLEHSLMELGAEMYQLRQRLFTISEQQDNYLKVLKQLQNILNEKGVIDEEDFEDSMKLELNMLPHDEFDDNDMEEFEIPGDKREFH